MTNPDAGPVTAVTGGIPLRAWQQDAVERWIRNAGRGIIEAATGSGKTRVAIAAIAVTRSVWPQSLGVMIIVPTRALMHQWVDRLATFGMQDVGLLGDGHYPTVRHDTIVAVINSARSESAPILTRWRSRGYATLLIVDECHRAGSPSNAKIFDNPYDFAMGISATPERDGDSATSTVLIPSLGDIIMTYTRAQAEEDEVIAPVDLVDITVQLTDWERRSYGDLTGEIERARTLMLKRYPELLFHEDDLIKAVGDLKHRQARSGVGVDPVLEAWTVAIMRRRRLLASAKNRRLAADGLLRQLPDDEVGYLFHEQIDQAERTYAFLSDRGLPVGVYHSKLATEDLERTLDQLRRSQIRWIACVRALDEGIDTPEASTAIIIAGTFSRRQLIQRLGRVSRPHGGERAIAYRLLVEDELARLPNIGGRRALIRWPDDEDLFGDRTGLDLLLERSDASSVDDFDDDWSDDESTEVDYPRWSKAVDPARNLLTPVANRVLRAYGPQRVLTEHITNAPTQAADEARRLASEADRLLKDLSSALSTPHLSAGWPDRLRRIHERLRLQLHSSRSFNESRFHAARTRARHELQAFTEAQDEFEAVGQQTSESRDAAVQASAEKHASRLRAALAAGTPIEVYVNKVTTGTALVTVRRTLLTAGIRIPEDSHWTPNTRQMAVVTAFDETTGTIELIPSAD